MSTNHKYLIYINKPDLALNNSQWLICHQAKPNQIPPAMVNNRVDKAL